MAALVEIGSSPERRFELGEVSTIGRDPACALRVDDPLVAGRHALVRCTHDGRYELVDLGSRRGTYVGERRVSSQVLRHGDEILVGPVRLRFEEAARPGRDEARATLRRSSDVVAHAAVELTAALEHAADLPAMMAALLRTALEVVGAERGAVLLIGEGEARPYLQLARKRDGTPTDVTLSTTLLSEVVARRAGVVTANALDDPRLYGATSLVAQRVRSAMCVPLLHQGEQLGVLHLDSQAGDAFNEGKLALATAMARQASVAIRSALLARKVDAAAQAERERLEQLLADLPDGVLLVEQDGRIGFANPLARKLLELLGVAPEGVLSELGGYTLGELLSSHTTVELPSLGPSGRLLVASARETSGGGAGAALVTLRDVTVEREREARAAQHERLAVMGQLAAGVAHDFNNILSVISNFAQFVLDDLVEPRQRDDQLQVLEAARRAAQLVKQLLAFGRREVVRPQVVRLDRLVGGVERLLRGAVGEHIDLRVRVPLDLWRVKVDPAMLAQVLLNLVVNARDAMPGGGVLTIDGSNRTLSETEASNEGLAAGRYDLLEVTDTGVGMPPHVVSRVFEPFFTTKGPGKGTGLGLATAYGIAQQAGGTITVRTEPSQGSTFSVWLPATEEADADLPPEAVKSRGHGETVLVAEDERPVRDLTRRILTDAGYRVLDAGSGQEALEVAAHHSGSIDLLLTDVVMPGLSGKQLAQQLALRRPNLRVLYMSGYFDGSAELGQALLPKPFQRDGLLERVRAAMAAPSTGGAAPN